MMGHLTEGLTAIPAHALVTTRSHSRVLRRSQANNALILLLLLLFHFEHFNNKLLLVKSRLLLLLGLLGLQLTALPIICTCNQCLLKLIVFLSNIIRSLHGHLSRHINNLRWLGSSITRCIRIKIIESLLTSPLSLLSASLQFLIHFQDEDKGVAAHQK